MKTFVITDGQKFCESYDAINTDSERVETQQTSFAIMRAYKTFFKFLILNKKNIS